MGRKVDTEVFAGQLMAQNTLIEILMGQIVLTAPDRGAAVRGAPALGVSVIRNNPNLTGSEKFGAGKTLDDALDTLDRIMAAAGKR
jgi:hypothetical protein